MTCSSSTFCSVCACKRVREQTVVGTFRKGSKSELPQGQEGGGGDLVVGPGTAFGLERRELRRSLARQCLVPFGGHTNMTSMRGTLMATHASHAGHTRLHDRSCNKQSATSKEDTPAPLHAAA